MNKQISIGIGGTFDYLHIGHKNLINFASKFTTNNKLIIGVTSPLLTKHKLHPHSIQSFHLRFRQVADFCAKQKIPAQIFTLTNEFGPTISNNSPDILCVTYNTVAGAIAIQKKRHTLQLPPLPTIVAPTKKDKRQQTISSTRIRMGEIDENGLIFADILQDKHIFSREQIALLKKPLGKIVDKPNYSIQSKIIIVGDVTWQRFSELKWQYNIAIIDGKNKRQPIKARKLRVKETINNALTAKHVRFSVKNPPNTLQPDLAKTIKIALANNSQTTQIINVIGEEDLAVLPAILLAPLDSYIYYGQPNEGLVEVRISLDMKKFVYQLLLKSANMSISTL